MELLSGLWRLLRAVGTARVRSTEPVPVTDIERGGTHPETRARIHDLAAQHRGFREKLNQRQHLMPGDALGWAVLGGTVPGSSAPQRDAILQHPKPEITPSAMILRAAAEHDIEPEAAG